MIATFVVNYSHALSWVCDARLSSKHPNHILRSFHQLTKMFQRDPRACAFLGGDRVSGQDVRDQNGKFCTICCNMATHPKIARNSFGCPDNREYRENVVGTSWS